MHLVFLVSQHTSSGEGATNKKAAYIDSFDLVYLYFFDDLVD